MSTAIFGNVGDSMCHGFLRRMDSDPFAAQKNFTRVGRGDAEQDAGQFRAPGSHESGQPENFGGANFQGNVPHVA